MDPKPIDHIALLVENIEEAMERWTKATGYTFNPIARYRAERYVDPASPTPRLHENRVVFSVQGPPHIELIEVVGDGTHGPHELGPHHIGLRGFDDLGAWRDELAAVGIGSDAASLDEAGVPCMFFTERAALDGLRIEMISNKPGPIFTDDGTRQYPRDPVTGKADFSAFG